MWRLVEFDIFVFHKILWDYGVEAESFFGDFEKLELTN